MIQLLADTAHMVPGEWITTFVVAIIGAGATAWAKISGRKEGLAQANTLTLGTPVPTVPVTKVPGVVTWNDHKNLSDRVDRIEGHINQLRHDQGKQFQQLLESGQERELRIIEKIDTVAREWHARLDAQFITKTRTPRQ